MEVVSELSVPNAESPSYKERRSSLSKVRTLLSIRWSCSTRLSIVELFNMVLADSNPDSVPHGLALSCVTASLCWHSRVRGLRRRLLGGRHPNALSSGSHRRLANISACGWRCRLFVAVVYRTKLSCKTEEGSHPEGYHTIFQDLELGHLAS